MLIQTIHHDALPGFVADEHINWAGVGSFYGYLTSGFSVPNVTFTKVIWNAESWDTLSEFNPATGLYTASAAGRYIFTASAIVTTPGNGKIVIVGIAQNGTLKAIGRVIPGGNIHAGACVAVVLNMAQSDTAEVQVYHDSGVARNLLANTGYCHFSGHRIG